MAGFRSPAPWLGLSSQPVTTQAGFRTPLPNFNGGGTPSAAQAGFRTPLPSFNGGGTPSATQAGFRGLLGFWSGGLSTTPTTSAPSSGGLSGYPAGGKLCRVAHFGAPLSSVRSSFFASIESDVSAKGVEPPVSATAEVRTPKRERSVDATPAVTYSAVAVSRDDALARGISELLEPGRAGTTAKLADALRNIAKQLPGVAPEGVLPGEEKSAILEEPDYLALRLLLLLEG